MVIDGLSYLPRNNIIKIIGIVFVLTLLSACGGGGGDSEDETLNSTRLHLTSMPVTGQTVRPLGVARFEITGLTPGTLYSFSFAGNNSISLNVLGEPDFSNLLCFTYKSSSSGNCSVYLFEGTSLFVRVNDTSGLGATFTLDVTVPTPTELDFVSMPATGQTVSPSGDSFYEITGLTPGALYSISIAGNNSNRFDVSDDSNFFSHVLCESSTLTAGGNCSASPSGTSLFVRVRDTSGLGVTFTLDVTVPTPIVLDISSMPATGQTVSPGGETLFEITGLTPGVLYTVSIAGNNTARFHVFETAGFSKVLCRSFATSGSGSCSTAPSGASLFLRMRDESGLGDIFTLDVTIPTPTVLDLSSMPATGQTVSPGGEALFEITGLTPGTLYSVSIAGNNNNRVSVFDDPNFSNFLCNFIAPTGSGNCLVTASGTSLFLLLKDDLGLGDTFSLDVTVATPIVLDFSSLPATGKTVPPSGETLFEITGLTPGAFYSVSIAGNNTNQLSVYDDPSFSFSSLLCFLTRNGNCSASPSGTSLFLHVQDGSGFGDTFTLDVVVTTPIVLDILSMPATGQTVSPGGEALFEITGLTPGTLYSVSIAGNNNNRLSVLDDSSFSFLKSLCNSFASTGSGNCSASPSGTSLFLRVKDDSGFGDNFALDVTEVTPTVLDLSSMPTTGQTVSPGGETLFEITGLTPGVLYSVSVAENDTVTVQVFDDPGFSDFLCSFSAASSDPNCSAIPSGTSLSLRVTEFFGSGETFTLDVNVATP